MTTSPLPHVNVFPVRKDVLQMTVRRKTKVNTRAQNGIQSGHYKNYEHEKSP